MGGEGEGEGGEIVNAMLVFCSPLPPPALAGPESRSGLGEFF